MPLTQVIYLSRHALDSQAGPLEAQLERILEVSRRNNRRDGLSGYLVSAGPWFLQTLEGEEPSVMAAMARICRDPRHCEVGVVSLRQIRSRSFPQWSMGAAVRTPAMQAIFRRHGLDEIDPAALTAPSILGLMMDLQDHERAHAPAAAG